jgi:hypothetical protein
LPEDKAFEIVDLATPASLAACPRLKYMRFPIVLVGVWKLFDETLKETLSKSAA